MTVLISNLFPLPPPLGVGNPCVGAGPPKAGMIGEVVLRWVWTCPGDMSMALGSWILKRGWPELGQGPQFVEGQGVRTGL